MKDLSAQILSHLQTFPGVTDDEIEQTMEFAAGVRERLEDGETFELSPQGEQSLQEFDGAPYCSYGHKTKAQCDCGPIANNE